MLVVNKTDKPILMGHIIIPLHTPIALGNDPGMVERINEMAEKGQVEIIESEAPPEGDAQRGKDNADRR
jgi:hypothetical protein